MNRRQVFAAAVAGLFSAVVVCGAALAAGQWYQFVCQKCGDKWPKNQHDKPLPDRECVKFYRGKQCGGLCVDTPCPPPG